MGTIALSLMMLAGYGGMVSLAQMTAAGLITLAIAVAFFYFVRQNYAV